VTWTSAPPRWRLAPVPQAPRWIGDTPAERVASIVADDRRWAAALRWTRRQRALYVAAEQIRAGLLLVAVTRGVARARPFRFVEPVRWR
jgi:hypothetical protein